MAIFKSNVLIVDPFSSGAQFAKIIQQDYGFNCLALITNKNLPQFLLSSFREKDFFKVFTIHHSINETVTEIENSLGAAPEYILCGSEPGVLVFDILSNRWNLLTNDIMKSQARRNKYLMLKQLQNDGIKHIPFFKSSNINEILSWAQSQPFSDYVIKPILSFGTEDVNFCRSENEIIMACENLLEKIDYAGNINHEILIQQLIRGDEFVVDVVSSCGYHHVVNIFKYTKQEINGVPLYQSMISVDVDENPQLEEYIKSVLDALGVQNGPSHNEVMLTESGPILIECGARMHGGLGPRLVEATNSQSLIDLSIMSRINPKKFREIIQSKPYLFKYAAEYFMSSKVDGIINMNNVKSKCSTIESYEFDTCELHVGDHINKTRDLLSSFARIVMTNTSLDKLNADLVKICSMDERNELISIVPRGMKVTLVE